MHKGKLLVLAVFVVVVGVAIGIQRLGPFRAGPTTVPGSPPAVSPALKPVDVRQFRGFSLQLQSANPRHPYERYVDEIAGTGANTVCLVVAAYQENGASTSIFLDSRRVPSATRMRRLMAHARRRKLHVVVMPIVLLENPRAGEWRGAIDPKNWDHWWEDYYNYVLHYAQIAQAGEAKIFVIGSELVTTEKRFADRWLDLIRRVRKVYHGHLSYSANWDHYRPVTWWDKLDIIGMTTYYDLTGGKKPTLPRLLKSWQPIRKDVLAWQREIRRPILFTEVGWPNQVTAAQFPWDYTRSPDKPDPTAQANCFDAFLRTWIGEPCVAGFLVWEWRSYPGQPIGPKDTSYVPCGKPALNVIRKHFQAPDPRAPATRPAATRPAATSASAPATRGN
jgi:hypothetical protein